jgi:large subunit ribosomal protein L24
MRIKKGDQVQVMRGADAGKVGKVVKVLPEEDRLVVEGVNVAVRHTRRKRETEKGQRLELPMPLPRARVMLICPKCNKPTRVRMQVAGEAKHRRCIHCKETF